MGAPGRFGHPLLPRGSWGEARRDGALLDIFGQTSNVIVAPCFHAMGRFKADRQLN